MKDPVKKEEFKSNTTTLTVSEEVFERLKRISVENNTDMKGAVHSIIHNKTGKLKTENLVSSANKGVLLDPDVYERLDAIRKKTGLALGIIIYCLVYNKEFPKANQKQCVHFKAFREDVNKLSKMKKNTVETHSSLLLKLLNNGEEIEYISRW